MVMLMFKQLKSTLLQLGEVHDNGEILKTHGKELCFLLWCKNISAKLWQ